MIKVLMKVMCHRGKHVMTVIWSFWCAVQLRNKTKRGVGGSGEVHSGSHEMYGESVQLLFFLSLPSLQT